GAQLVAIAPKRRVLIGLECYRHELREVHLGKHLARVDRLIMLAAQRDDARLIILEHPQLSNAEASIDLELVDRRRRHDDLDRDVRNFAIRSAAVTLVRLESALFGLVAKR